MKIFEKNVKLCPLIDQLGSDRLNKVKVRKTVSVYKPPLFLGLHNSFIIDGNQAWDSFVSFNDNNFGLCYPPASEASKGGSKFN